MFSKRDNKRDNKEVVYGGTILPPLKPIPIKDRISVVFVEKGNLDVLDGAFVVVDKNGVRTHIPVGGVACLMLEPGTRVSHAAVALASRVGVCWFGSARPGCGSMPPVNRAGLGPTGCFIRPNWPWMMRPGSKVVRKMYELRFKEKPPEKRSIEQLRGIEAVRVRKMYELLARQFGVEWKAAQL